MLINGLKAPDLIRMSDVVMKEMTWLWYPYIPTASATMIFGPGGHGKSHIAVDIASRITRGDAFPNDKDSLPAQNVLMMSAEDELDRVLGPRLVAAGADLNRVIAPAKAFTLNSTGLAFVKGYIDKASVGIVFIDPVVSYIGAKVNMNQANETREFTGGLHQLAMDTGVPIVIVHHSRKGNEGADWERAMGSVDFNNAVRSVMYVTRSPSGDPIMRHVKANYSPLGPTLGFQFGPEGFKWTGTYKEDGEKAPDRASKRSEVKEWLQKKLADGPVKAANIERSASMLGYNHRTMVRAKEGLAKSTLVSEDGKMVWYWSLINDITDEPADLPVMDGQWSTTSEDRTTREIKAREDERTSRNARPVGKRGPRTLDGGAFRAPGPLNDAELEAWMKDNL